MNNENDNQEAGWLALVAATRNVVGLFTSRKAAVALPVMSKNATTAPGLPPTGSSEIDTQSVSPGVLREPVAQRVTSPLARKLSRPSRLGGTKGEETAASAPSEDDAKGNLPNTDIIGRTTSGSDQETSRSVRK